MDVEYHGNILKKMNCFNLLMHYDNQIIIVKAFSKNVNEKSTYKNESQIY